MVWHRIVENLNKQEEKQQQQQQAQVAISQSPTIPEGKDLSTVADETLTNGQRRRRSFKC
jgi:hypothetical protein